MTNLEVGEIVLCTVDRIEKANVIVKVHIPGQVDLDGNIMYSEIAPGRIRNIRDFVVPKKKIVCKILRISGNRLDLSLRRVTQKEQKELIEQEKQEKSYQGILKAVVKEKAQEIISKIREQDSLYNFLQESKTNSKALETIVGKKEASKIIEILNSQKQKKAIIKKIINLKSTAPDGIIKIKNILSEIKYAKVQYIAAGKYALTTEGKDLKTIDKIMKEVLEKIETQAKTENLEFNIKEK